MYIFTTHELRGGVRNFPMGAYSSDEGAKIWFSGYYKCQKSPKKSLFTFRRGASMLRRGAIALPWRHPCMSFKKTFKISYISTNFDLAIKNLHFLPSQIIVYIQLFICIESKAIQNKFTWTMRQFQRCIPTNFALKTIKVAADNN